MEVVAKKRKNNKNKKTKEMKRQERFWIYLDWQMFCQVIMGQYGIPFIVVYESFMVVGNG
jgi:hypothetical protein